MKEIKAYKINEDCANIKPLDIKREWMDNTWNSHAYHCFPVSLANQLGWSISFPEDISFIWDGISDSSPDHVKILKGHKYVYTGRANSTISFHTGIILKTNENVSIFQMPVPNLFLDGVQTLSNIMSTSFYEGEIPCVLMITKPNVEILIKANTPIASFIPIDISEMQNSIISFEDKKFASNNKINSLEYSKAIESINASGKWSDFYRNATDHVGNKIGKHQAKSIKFHVN